LDPTLYFTFLVGGLALCVLAAVACRVPKRDCPSCGVQTPIQARRCRNCGYSARA
jgi:ribosomal protein L40E